MNLFGFADPDRQDGQHRDHPVHRGRGARLGGRVDRAERGRPGDRADQYGGRPVVRRCDPHLGAVDLRRGDLVSHALSAAYQEANNELLNLHHLTNPTAADFTINSQQSLLTTATSVDKTLTVLLGGIAGISLLVGGIGVMNIMLVSVTEVALLLYDVPRLF